MLSTARPANLRQQRRGTYFNRIAGSWLSKRNAGSRSSGADEPVNDAIRAVERVPFGNTFGRCCVSLLRQGTYRRRSRLCPSKADTVSRLELTKKAKGQIIREPASHWPVCSLPRVQREAEGCSVADTAKRWTQLGTFLGSRGAESPKKSSPEVSAWGQV